MAAVKGLTFKVEENPTLMHMTLDGSMDEYSDYPSLADTKVASLTIDFSGIGRCNSMGVLKWARFLKSLPRTLSLRLTRCSTVLIKQFNFFASFTDHPGLTIESFSARYCCPQCSTEKEKLLVASDVKAKGLESTAVGDQCEHCHVDMELEDRPDKAFLFLTRMWKTAAG